MKTLKLFLLFFFALSLFPELINSQDLNVHFMIGKNKNAVTQKYGKPVHQDNSDPNMICMFYQDKDDRMTFVSNQGGVFQAESYKYFSTEKGARNAVDAVITGSIAESFTVDTVTINDFTLQKPGVTADLQMSENKITNKYNVKVTARKSTE